MRFALERLARDHEEFALTGGPRATALNRAAEVRSLIQKLEDDEDVAGAGENDSLSAAAFASIDGLAADPSRH
ncbi:MAG TPA: hypothetical protein VGF45_03150 [Polyangia bacterium]